jgi:hypothetical protein
MTLFLTIIAAGLFLHRGAAAAIATSANHDIALHAHFRGLIETQAHTFSHAAPLPLAAAGPILHVDLDLVSRKTAVQAPFLKAILEEETATRAAAPSDTRFPYVLCGPQSSSREARREIAAASGLSHRTQVVYLSRLLDVACWKGQFRNADAIAMESSASFFHVAPIPKISKLAPGLVQAHKPHKDSDAGAMERLTINPLVVSQGLTVYFDPSSTQGERRFLHHHWIGTKYGLAVAAATEESFVPTTWAKSTADAAPWADKKVPELDCSSILNVNTGEEYTGFGSLLLNFESLTENAETVSTCIQAVLLHLASSSEVAGIGITKKVRPGGLPSESKSNYLRSQVSDKGRTLEHDSGDVGTSNYIAVTALQSGDSNKPYPFWNAGINGSNQFVQVTDTGFDDASCFLRDTDASKSVLKGPFNFDVQLARSTYDSPITDLSRRKIVQYIKVSTSSDTYGYDYEDGHGTHVAGTVAGLLSNRADNVAGKNYLSSCSDYSSECNTYFCATCPYANYCDGMCGFLDDEDFTGMAPSAKVMVKDIFKHTLRCPAYMR